MFSVTLANCKRELGRVYLWQSGMRARLLRASPLWAASLRTAGAHDEAAPLSRTRDSYSMLKSLFRIA
jgi:hypothetical protein